MNLPTKAPLVRSLEDSQYPVDSYDTLHDTEVEAEPQDHDKVMPAKFPKRNRS